MAATPTLAERHALTEMTRLMAEARGDHPALAEVRRQIAAQIDELVALLRAAGVDTDALQDEIDATTEETQP